jgi:DNA-binding transcriptional LysR family regulator
MPMRSVVTVDNFKAYEAAGLAGLGIVQIPRGSAQRYGDALVEILPAYSARPSPISLLHTHERGAPRRVRAVLTWLTEVLQPLVATATATST